MINKMHCMISIAMSTYNGSKYLAQQLDSIVNQSYSNLELIIIDDCSKDNTIEIIKSYQQKYKFIKLYQNQINIGAVKSFEKAISLCTGEYIALSDQDDVWLPNKLEELVSTIGDNLLIHSDAIVVDDNMKVIAVSHFGLAKKEHKNSELIDYLITNNVTGCTAMLPRKLVKLALPFPDKFYVHDHYLAIIASFYGKVKLLDKPLVYYRQHSANSIGAVRPSFEQFIFNCKEKANSYNSLLAIPIFNNNAEIELIRDYRLSMYHGKWISRYSIFKVLSLKHGLKLFIYYMLIAGFSRGISKKIYNYIYGVKVFNDESISTTSSPAARNQT